MAGEFGIHYEKQANDRLSAALPSQQELILCHWIEEGRLEPADTSLFCATIGFGLELSATTQSDLIAIGYSAVYDLEETPLEAAASMAIAYGKQKASKVSIAPPERLTLELPEQFSTISPDAKLAYLASAVDCLDIGVYVTEKNEPCLVRVWNKQMERLFGINRDKVINKPLGSIFEDPVVRNLFSRPGNGRAIIPSPGRARESLIADVSKSTLEGSNQESALTVGFVQDVTHRVNAENKLVAAFKELESSKERLETSNLEIRKGIEKAKRLAVLAQSSNKAKSYFLSNISHELRTPLNSIVSLTHALLEGAFGELSQRQTESLEIVSDSSNHLAHLINDILDLSKIELGKLGLRFTSVPFSEIASSCLNMIAQEAKAKRVKCSLVNNCSRTEMVVDPRRLRQILLNLLVNAVKFTRPDTEVNLIIDECADTHSIKFQISDQGIGIPEKDFNKIFYPFTQLDDSLSKQYEGTGLGLAIASKLTELHGGGISVRSQVGKGTVFTFALPYDQIEPAEDSRIMPKLSDLIASEDSLSGICILVDEHTPGSFSLSQQIQKLTNLTPVAAMPNEVSAYHDQVAPAAIFVDIGILESHGTDWLATAKKNVAWKKTKWIAIGSVDLPSNHESAKSMGFHACSCKPISSKMLASLLGG